ncbi:MAG: histidine kinase [Actinomycetota bacterium]|nr:histidine kinase [Actinomycetota bacterium]
MAASTGEVAPTGAVAAQPSGVDRTHPGRVRLGWGDVAFSGFLVVYTAFALAALLGGAGAVLARALPTLHDRLHEWALGGSDLGHLAEAMADASHRVLPAWQLVLDYAFSLFNLGLAGFLLWLRPRDRTARLLAVAMVGTAAAFNLQAYGTYEALEPTWLESLAHEAFHLVAAASYVLALLLFPDGRVVPRWTRAPLLAFYGVAASIVAVLGTQIRGTSRTLAIIMIFGLLAPLVGVAAQVYRYRHAPTPVERQQSRLLFWALSPALLLGVFVLFRGVNASAFEEFVGRPIDVIPVNLFRLFQPVFAIIPVALFIGLLRFRLWNVDRVISRTLVYSALAGFVAAVYVLVVVGVGQVIGTTGDNAALLILATGVVAVAFEPVKERVQQLANRLVYGRRATPYEILSAFSERVGETVATEELLTRMTRLLAEGTAAVRAEVWLVVSDEVRRAASWPEQDGAPSVVPLDGDKLPDLGNVTAAVPVLHHAEVLGALTVTKPASESLSPNEEKLLADLAGQAGLVLRNVRLTAQLLARLEELKASRQRLVTAQDEQRHRLERNIHDGAQQELISIKVRLGLAEQLAKTGKPVDQLLRQLNEDTGAAIDNLRTLARGIYPPLLASEGLVVALRAQAGRVPVPVEVNAEPIGRFAREVEAAVYFCCLEALQNASKYAEASRVVVTLTRDGRLLRFVVSDDGCGFEADSRRFGSGIQNMIDRLEALDGTLEIRSSPGQGTTVTGCVPGDGEFVAS